MRGFRFQWQFDGEVQGAAQFFLLEPNAGCTLEVAARANPAQFHWRDDAMNAYIVAETLDSQGKPKCKGFAHGPLKDCGDGAPGGIVVMCAHAAAGLGMVHEFGHYIGLGHTFEGADQVADTPLDADPRQCSPRDGNTPHAEECDVVAGANSECCCATKTALTMMESWQQGWSADVLAMMLNNLMSYHCDNADDFALSDGQLDRFADMARRYRAAACSGVTWFVDLDNASGPFDGYSTEPFATVQQGIAAANPAGGDIVVIRAGSYDEALTIAAPVTLRASRGTVVIGQ